MTAAPPAADGNPTNLRTCTVPDCGRPFYARGRCARCYQRCRLGLDEWTPPARAGWSLSGCGWLT